MNAIRLGNAPIRPAQPPDQVAIYTTPDEVPGKYEEVALLSAQGEDTWTRDGDMLAALRKKAARLGANAIVLGDLGRIRATPQTVGETPAAATEEQIHAVAIFVFPKGE